MSAYADDTNDLNEIMRILAERAARYAQYAFRVMQKGERRLVIYKGVSIAHMRMLMDVYKEYEVIHGQSNECDEG